jgi:cytochrome c5
MFSMNLRSLALASVITIIAPAALAMGGSPQTDDAAVSARIQPVARLEMAGTAAMVGGGGNRSGAEMVKAICSVCHAPTSAIALSPKIGDKAAWAPRIGVGLDVLTKTAIAGKNTMPPKGGAVDATELEIARAIVFMTNQSGASFKEPAVGGAIAPTERSAEQIAEGACLKCHETGEKGAPKLSDKAAWAQRTSKGLDAVTKTVIRGHGNMPARGGLADLTDTELKSTIAYLLKRVGSNTN